MQNQECQILCTKNYQDYEYDNFKWLIEKDYHYTLLVDELPSAFIQRSEEKATVKYENGIPLGILDKGDNNIYVYNHLEFTIQVHETIDDENTYRIVGFKIEPIS